MGQTLGSHVIVVDALGHEVPILHSLVGSLVEGSVLAQETILSHCFHTSRQSVELALNPIPKLPISDRHIQLGDAFRDVLVGTLFDQRTHAEAFVLIFEHLDLLLQDCHLVLVSGSQTNTSLQPHDLLEVLVQFLDLNKLLLVSSHDLFRPNTPVDQLEDVGLSVHEGDHQRPNHDEVLGRGDGVHGQALRVGQPLVGFVTHGEFAHSLDGQFH